MEKRIVFLQESGEVWLTTIDDEHGEPRRKDESDQQYIDRMIAKRKEDCELRGIAFGSPVAVVDPEEIDVLLRTTFRGGRAWDGERVVPDMARCRAIKCEQLRAFRASKFQALDAAYFIADEVGDLAKKQEIIRKKQALRDLPSHPAIEAARTLQELDALQPEELGISA